jgi:hypothetical protein
MKSLLIFLSPFILSIAAQNGPRWIWPGCAHDECITNQQESSIQPHCYDLFRGPLSDEKCTNITKPDTRCSGTPNCEFQYSQAVWVGLTTIGPREVTPEEIKEQCKEWKVQFAESSNTMFCTATSKETFVQLNSAGLREGNSHYIVDAQFCGGRPNGTIKARHRSLNRVGFVPRECLVEGTLDVEEVALSSLGSYTQPAFGSLALVAVAAMFF